MVKKNNVDEETITRIRRELLKYDKVEMASKLCLLLGFTFLVPNTVLFISNGIKGDLIAIGHLLITVVSFFGMRKSYDILEEKRCNIVMEFLEKYPDKK